MAKMILSGAKYPPHKGTYYRLFEENDYERLVFEHILKDLDCNERIYGLKASELHDFNILADIHGFTVHIV